MIGELVPESEPNWENYTLMLRITDCVFAPVTSVDIAFCLKTLIKEHHECFKDLYPSALIIPKMHYMIHLPEWIIMYVVTNSSVYIKNSNMFGPPSRYLCMRFEAKHSYFKKIGHVVRNFKNIPKTIAERHQTQMCYELSQADFAKQFCYGRIRYALPQWKCFLSLTKFRQKCSVGDYDTVVKFEINTI